LLSSPYSPASVPDHGKRSVNRAEFVFYAGGFETLLQPPHSFFGPRFQCTPETRSCKRKGGAGGASPSCELKTTLLNTPDGPDFGLGVDFVLAQHHGCGAESFDDGAHVGPDAGGGEQAWQFAASCLLLERIPHGANKLLKVRRGHGQLFFLARA